MMPDPSPHPSAHLTPPPPQCPRKRGPLLRRWLVLEHLSTQAHTVSQGAGELPHHRPQGSGPQARRRRSLYPRGAPTCEAYGLRETSSIPPQGAPCQSLSALRLTVLHCGNSAITPLNNV